MKNAIELDNEIEHLLKLLLYAEAKTKLVGGEKIER